MTLKIGEKIKNLRKAQNVSQDTLAQYLGISFQSVSKWENGYSMPDISMIPAIASFFDISIDELFDINKMEAEKRIDKICFSACQYLPKKQNKS